MGFKKDLPNIITGIVYSAKDSLPLAGVKIHIKNDPGKSVLTDSKGVFKINSLKDTAILVVSHIGFETQEVKVHKNENFKLYLKQHFKNLEEVVMVVSPKIQKRMNQLGAVDYHTNGIVSGERKMYDNPVRLRTYDDTESYNTINENQFKNTTSEPLSTFSIDVDAASYSNVRRFLSKGQLPPVDAIRIEEMINYFNYDYTEPVGDQPVGIATEITSAPWNTMHRLVKISLKGKTIAYDKLPASNLVFLIDVSGSMQGADRLDLVKTSMKLLANQLRENDKVSIVVYAGAAGLVLPATPGSDKIKIKDAINNLEAGGSTAGGAGIKLAYKIATENFIKGGNNRVILATDGDFNVGSSSDSDMQKLIEQNRKSGVFLTVLGYGMGNLKDSKMEILADQGNGNYAYIDNLNEAKKVLINEFGGTLFTIAKDVKLQIEFNPAKVQAYRLIGYENRLLNKEDFNNDTKDAGDLGSGHTVTALYEVIPVGIKNKFTGVDDLKYQSVKPVSIKSSQETLTVKLRYKNPNEDKSKLLESVVFDKGNSYKQASADFKFAAAVAQLGMLLKQSEYAQNSNFDTLIQLAKESKGKDENGYRAEFIQLAENAQLLSEKVISSSSNKPVKKAIKIE